MSPEEFADPCLFILNQLHEVCRRKRLNDWSRPTWEDAQFLRVVYFQYRGGDCSAWRKLMLRMSRESEIAFAVRDLLLELQLLQIAEDPETADLAFLRELMPRYFHEHYGHRETVELGELPPHLKPLTVDSEDQLLAVLNVWDAKWRFSFRRDPNQYLLAIERLDPEWFAPPAPTGPSVIKYIEEKPGLAGHARIGRVRYSKSKKTLYYRGRTLRSLKGRGYKANYVNVETRLRYWISNCKRNGDDTLYPGIIEIDEDAREEYWLQIRKQPENLHLMQFRSLGKYSNRRPK